MLEYIRDDLDVVNLRTVLDEYEQWNKSFCRNDSLIIMKLKKVKNSIQWVFANVMINFNQISTPR